MTFIAKLKTSRKPTSFPSMLVIDGAPVPVRFRRHRSARRIILRLEPTGDGIVLTLPWSASQASGLDFAASQAAWIWSARQLRSRGVALAPGALIPLRGVPHTLAHRPDARGGVWTETGHPPHLVVTGDPRHVGRRIEDWLKRESKRDLTAASTAHAQRMNVRFARLSIRDTTSRWGSCSSGGSLSYSWRLIFAPPFVLDYVAAHEVAHLVHMNHSRTFWALVRRHCPRAEEARRWLKANGPELHRYGAGREGDRA